MFGDCPFTDLGWGRRPPPLWSEKCSYLRFGALWELEPGRVPWAPPILVAAHFRIKDEQLKAAKRSGGTSTAGRTASLKTLDYWTVFVRAQSCPTLCDPMDCSLPGSLVHGIFQARMLERVAISSSRGIFTTQGLNPSLLCLLHW